MIKKCIAVGIWLISSVVNIFAQNMPTPLDDLAYVIEQEKDENRVQQALQDFQQETDIAFIVTMIYKDHPYAVSVQEYHQHWLQTQEKSISLIVEVNYYKAYLNSQLQVTADLEAILTETQRKQVIEEVMAPIFTGIPIPNDAYTRGLLAGIAAIKQALQERTTPAAYITFAPGPEQQYGFDEQQHASQMQHYEQSMVSNKPYAVAWKSIATGRQDIVVATDKNNGTIAEDIRFVSSTSGSVTSSAAGENKVQLTLTGKAHQMAEAVEVYQGKEKEETLVGKLKVISYDALRKKLIVVPVNEASVPDVYILQTKLNAIYGQATVNWEVVVEEKFTVEPDIIQDIVAIPAGVLSNYPKKMKELIKNYRKTKGEDKDAYYIFLINQKSDKLGYMPKKRQFGFAFTKHISQEQLITTIAHELAHGAFRLEHTFETYPALTKGSTSNLMDYAGGTHLHKYQWDLIHDPVKMLGWFQEEEEGANYDFCEVMFKDKLNTIHEANLSKAESVSFYWSGESQHCQLYNTQVNSSFLSIVEFIMPAKGNIQFHPLKYTRNETQKLGSHEGEFIIYEFGDFQYEDEPYVMLSLTVLKEESSALEEFLFGDMKVEEKEEEDGKAIINGAIGAMKAYLGTTYEQESGSLRTEDSEEGTEKMDCSEFVSRYLQKVTGAEKVPMYTTSDLSAFTNKQNSFLEYIVGSKEEDFKNILPGDVFLWRKDNGDGHTGVVVSYDEDTDQVTIIEAIGKWGSSQEMLSEDIEGYCKGCIRISIYSRTGKALMSHQGWKGYFRPKTNNNNL